jgi:hypothetical protein
MRRMRIRVTDNVLALESMADHRKPSRPLQEHGIAPGAIPLKRKAFDPGPRLPLRPILHSVGARRSVTLDERQCDPNQHQRARDEICGPYARGESRRQEGIRTVRDRHQSRRETI